MHADSNTPWSSRRFDLRSHQRVLTRVQERAKGRVCPDCRKRFESEGTLAWHLMAGTSDGHRCRVSTGAATPRLARLMTPQRTGSAPHVWSGELPPWDGRLGDFRGFTPQEIADGVCLNLERAGPT